MALWGSNDSVYSDGTVEVDYAALTVTGTGTTFDTGGVTAGDVIQIGAGSTFGEAVIVGVTSDVLSIASTEFLAAAPISGAAYNVSQTPKYALGVGETARGTTGPALVYGVDYVEVGVAATTAFSVTHSGWVAVAATYVDTNGNTRVKHEVLVAGGIDFAAGSDAEDDTVFPDPAIFITTDVADVVGIATTGDATFSVVATSNPDYAPLSYQWFEDTTELSDGGDYSGTTTATLTVANDNDKNDGREYSVVIASGDTSVTSGVGTITYA